MDTIVLPKREALSEAPRVFVSYSRVDHAFVSRLVAALEGRGFPVSVDLDDIEKGEDWWERIEALIGEADAVVFVLTPASLRSPVCAREVEFAASLHKRLVPVVAADLAGESVPPRLAALNYVNFPHGGEPQGDSALFEAALADLSRALVVDLAWIREHTRLGGRARRWEKAGRPADLLLRGAELGAAERWSTTRPHHAPEPTDDHRAFITESRRASARRQRIIAGASAFAVVVSLALAVVAWWQRDVALANERQAEASALEARERAAVLSAELAVRLGEEGIIDPALTLLLDAAQVFEGRQTPDEIVTAFEPVLARARRSTRHTFPREASVLFGPRAVHVIDPGAGVLKRLVPGEAPATVTALDGPVFHASLAASGAAMVLIDESLAVSLIDLSNGAAFEAGTISWDGPELTLFYDGTIRVSDDGGILIHPPAEEGRNVAALYDLGTKRTATGTLGDYVRLVPIPGRDDGGRRFAADAQTGEVYAADFSAGTLARAPQEDARWRPRFGCERVAKAIAPAQQSAIDTMLREAPGAAETIGTFTCLMHDGEARALTQLAVPTSAGAESDYVLHGPDGRETLQERLQRLRPGAAVEGDLASAAAFQAGTDTVALAFDRTVLVSGIEPGERYLERVWPLRTAGPARRLAFYPPTIVAIETAVGTERQVEFVDLAIATTPPALPAETFGGPYHAHLCKAGTLPLAEGGTLTFALDHASPAWGDGTITLARGGREHTLAVADASCLSLSRDGRRLLVQSTTVRVAAIDDLFGAESLAQAKGTTIAIPERSASIISAYFSGEAVVTGDTNGEVIRWRLDGERPVVDSVLYRGGGPITQAEPSPDGRSLLVKEHGHAGQLAVTLHSVSAGRTHVNVATAYKWYNAAFDAMGRIRHGYDPDEMAVIHPRLEAATEEARAALSPHCRSGMVGEDYTTSPCHPGL